MEISLKVKAFKQRRPLLATFVFAAFAALTWFGISYFLPDTNLAYTSGWISFLLSFLVTWIVAGFIAHSIGSPYEVAGCYMFSLAATIGFYVVEVVIAAIMLMVLPPDGQDGILIFYAFAVYPLVVFPGVWLSADLLSWRRWRH